MVVDEGLKALLHQQKEGRSRDRFQNVSRGRSSEDSNYENYVSRDTSLTEHLLSQLFEVDFSDQERAVAVVLIGNLDQNGYLVLDLKKFVEEEGLDLMLVEGVLDTIQRFDPSGVAARDLKECLYIQARELFPQDKELKNLIQICMKEVEGRKYGAISKALDIPVETVHEKIKLIEKLEPRPARPFLSSEPIYVVPDAYIYEEKGGWHVALNDEGVSQIGINKTYKDLLTDKNKEKDYLSQHLKSASWLLKCIKQRQETIFKVVSCIAEKQREFLEQGVEKLKPMVLRDIASAIQMHESTVSRVTHNKYVQTPRGIFELKYFFNSKLTNSLGEDSSSETIRAEIKKIITTEEEKKPYSDLALTKILKEKGMDVARRTVAKYREQLGILPSSRRKKIF